MPLLSRFIAGLRRLVRRTKDDKDLDDELRSYLEAAADRELADGAGPNDAARAARVKLGSLEAIKEQTRAVGWESPVQALGRDLRHGVRSLRRSPHFTGVVLLTMALTIGATVTTFSVMYAVLWRPLPYPNGERLVVLDRSLGPVQSDAMAPGEVRALRESSRLFGQIGVANGVDAFVTVGDRMERVPAASASDDVLELLGGVPLVLGRPLRAELDHSGEFVSAVAISHRLWRRMFDGDPAVVGRRIQVNNLDVQVVGVLPASLRVWLPASTGMAEEIDVWFPKALGPSHRDSEALALAKLPSGATLAEAQTELDQFAARFSESYAAEYAGGLGDGRLRFRVRFLQDVVTAPARLGLTALAAAVGFAFLVGCLNIAHLVLVRTQAREREIALRHALGGGRFRIVSLLITEVLVLTGVGTALGLLLSYGGITAIEWLRPGYLPRQSEITIDGAVALFSVGLAGVVAVTAGLLPALRATRARAVHPLIAVRSPVASTGTRRLQRTLVTLEVALSIVPLVTAGLMLRTFVNLSTAPLGFEPAGIVTAKVGLSLRLFPDAESRWALHRSIVAAVRQMPHVDGVSAASPLPFDAPQIARRFRRDDDPTDQGFAATQQSVLPGYLGIAGVRLLQGRDFSEEDIAAREDVAIVDARFADQIWGGGAMGQRLSVGSGSGLRVLQVVGVTEAVRIGPVRDRALPHVFLPYHVSPTAMALVVRTFERAETLGPALKRTAESLGTSRAVYDIRPMATYVDASVREERFLLVVLSAFALMTALPAAIGLYGTLTYLVARRRIEFGVRVALGASVRQIVGLVVKEGAALTGIGAVLGMAAALAVAAIFDALLYGVGPLDAPTLLGVAVVTACLAIAAISHPAWRAARLDPNRTLRDQ